MRSEEDKEFGLYRKFTVRRADGSSAPGEKHENCSYFVLDFVHDQYAIPALRAYAAACAPEFPLLAQDLVKEANANDVVRKRGTG